MKTIEPSIRKIARGYQVTLPPEFRKEHHLNVGDYVEIQEKNGKLIIEPIEIKKKSVAKQFDEIFASQKEDAAFAKKTEEEILALVRKEVKAARKANK